MKRDPIDSIESLAFQRKLHPIRSCSAPKWTNWNEAMKSVGCKRWKPTWNCTESPLKLLSRSREERKSQPVTNQPTLTKSTRQENEWKHLATPNCSETALKLLFHFEDCFIHFKRTEAPIYSAIQLRSSKYKHDPNPISANSCSKTAPKLLWNNCFI